MKFVLLVAFVLLTFSSLFKDKISDRVHRDLSLKNGHTSILIQMKKQVDFDVLTQNGKLSYEMEDVERGYFVMNTLMTNAKETQKEIIQILKNEKLSFKSFWVQNSITVSEAPKSLIHKLALREEVDYIGSDELNEMQLPESFGEVVTDSNQNQIEWNVRWVNADKLWEMGYNGTGIVVGGADTGIEYTHPALNHNYRGKTSNGYDHSYNWYDGVRGFNPCRSPCGCETKEPCDHGHGTHTLGTAVGGIHRKIGVSPGSIWIGCRPFTDTGRHYSVSTFLSCLQFFVAPTTVDGKQPKPELRPHSTIHSYGCNSALGCPGVRDLEAASNALKASGVLMIVAAHNQGPSCSTVTRQPCHFNSVITIGATGQNTDQIASYSSRGPIRVDNSGRRKPDLTAPGSNVLSANRRATYSTMSGTSMATPNVAGAMALFWSAVPSLIRNIQKTLEIFEKTAKHQKTNECSSNGSPNNVYGYGTIDVLKAYNLAKELGF